MRTVEAIDMRGLPQSVDTEKLILAAILKGTLDYRDCRGVLAPEDFALEAHRIIYRHMGVLSDAGRGVDRATALESIMRAQEIEAVGGISYMVDLDEGMPGLPKLDDYMRIVRDKSLLRKTIVMMETLKNDAIMEHGDPSELLGKAEHILASLGLEAARSSEFHRPGEIIRERGGLDSYLNRGISAGVPTGFDRFDDLTCGMRPGQLWIIAASTSGGKSTFARNIAFNAAMREHPGAIITLEMTEDEITDGLICHAGGINTQIIRRGLAFERDRTRAASVLIADLPIFIRDQSGATIPKIHGALRKLKVEHGIRWVIVDYLQLLSPVGKFGSRNDEVSHLTRGLKLIATELKVCVVALSQLTREPSKMKRRPELPDLRESGSIEQDANLVAFLYSEWQAEKMDIYPTELIVAKQRNGEVATIPFGFRKSTGSFFEESGGAQ